MPRVTDVLYRPRMRVNRDHPLGAFVDFLCVPVGPDGSNANSPGGFIDLVSGAQSFRSGNVANAKIRLPVARKGGLALSCSEISSSAAGRADYWRASIGRLRNLDGAKWSFFTLGGTRTGQPGGGLFHIAEDNYGTAYYRLWIDNGGYTSPRRHAVNVVNAEGQDHMLMSEPNTFSSSANEFEDHLWPMGCSCDWSTLRLFGVGKEWTTPFTGSPTAQLPSRNPQFYATRPYGIYASVDALAMGVALYGKAMSLAEFRMVEDAPLDLLEIAKDVIYSLPPLMRNGSLPSSPLVLR